MRWLLFGVVVVAACSNPSSIDCGFGVCPEGSSCDQVHQLCVTASQLTDCVGKPDGADCMVGDKVATCTDQVCIAPTCGDGIVNGIEQCDRDKFAVDAQGVPIHDCIGAGYYDNGPISCRSDCTIDGSQCTRTCGDGTTDPEEVCDYKAAGSTVTCKSLGFYADAMATCTPSCAYSTVACGGHCGDNVTDRPQELCDGTDPLPSYLSCLDYGFDAGRLACGGGCYADTNSCTHFNLWPVGAGGTLGQDGVYQPNAHTAFIVGSNGSGSFAKWDGNTITAIQIPAGSNLQDISGTSETNMWLVGGQGRIAHYDGTTFTDGNFGTVPFISVHMRTANDGYTVGGFGGTAVIRHFDGTSWNTMTPNTTETLIGVHALSATDQWAVGTGGLLLHGNGTTWTPTIWPGNLFLRSVWGTSSSDVFVVGDNGTILHYNGSWSAMPSPTTSTLYSVWGTASDDVFAAGFSVLLHYDGVHWVEIANSTTQPIVAHGTSLDRTHGLVLLQNAHLAKWEGAGWSPPKSLPDLPVGVWGSSETNVYVAMVSSVQHYDGTTWTSATTGNALTAIWGSTTTNDIFVSGGGEMLHFTGTWSSVTAPGNLFAMWGVASNEVYTVTEDGDAYRYDGATTFTSIGNSNVGTPYCMWASGPSDVYVGGEYGLAHYNGSTWTTIDDAHSHGAIWGTSATNVYTTADFGLQHYDGGSWTSVPIQNPSNAYFRGIHGTGPNDIFLVGDGLLEHYDGTVWTPIKSPTTDQMMGTWVFAHDIYGPTYNKQVYRLRRSCATCGL